MFFGSIKTRKGARRPDLVNQVVLQYQNSWFLSILLNLPIPVRLPRFDPHGRQCAASSAGGGGEPPPVERAVNAARITGGSLPPARITGGSLPPARITTGGSQAFPGFSGIIDPDFLKDGSCSLFSRLDTRE